MNKEFDDLKCHTVTLRFFSKNVINFDTFPSCKLFIGWYVAPVRIRNLQVWVYFEKLPCSSKKKGFVSHRNAFGKNIKYNESEEKNLQ